MIKIPITRLTVGGEEADAVRRVLESGWLIQGAKVREFEEQVRRMTRTKYAVACTSCTTALHMGLVALDIQPGDEVMVPAFTFVATPNAARYVGAKPVFVDIDIDTFNIDCHKLEKAVAESKGSTRPRRPRAIIPVHLFGMCADMQRVQEIAKNYDLVILEDAACAIGSSYNNRLAGQLGNAACFSFHPRKSITTGEGGMLVTDDQKIYEQVRSLRDFGFDQDSSPVSNNGKPNSLPEVRMLGWNFRMTDIQAAIGVEQFKKLGATIAARQKLAKVYDTELAKIPWLKLPTTASGCNHTYQSYVTLVWDERLRHPISEIVDRIEGIRNRLMAYLEENGIATRQGTQAVHMLDYYQRKYRIKPMDVPMAWIAARMSVTLPLFPQMTNEEQDYVIGKIKEFKP